MAEEDKNSSPLDEGTEIIAHTAQTAYATTAAVAAGGTAAGMAAGTALAGPLGTVIGALVSNKTVWKILVSIFLFCFLWMFIIANMIGIIFSYLGFANAQKLMGRMEQYIVEARGVLQSCIRRQSEFQYAYLGDMIQETAKTSERLTDKLRRMTLEIVVNPKEYEKYKEDLVLIHGIELEYKDEILRVSAPVLIPHRKDCYTDYLYKPLHTAFRNWCMQRAEEKLEIPTYTNCTICFVHVYDETLPLARVRDHDNYEEKHVQDIITNFFLQSDSGLYTNTCHVTRMGEEDRTLLYVMDSSKFPAWISDFGKETGIEKNHE